MKRKIYFYTCMGCGVDWDSTVKENVCHVCGSPDIAEEVEEDDENSNETRESD